MDERRCGAPVPGSVRGLACELPVEHFKYEKPHRVTVGELVITWESGEKLSLARVRDLEETAADYTVMGTMGKWADASALGIKRFKHEGPSDCRHDNFPHFRSPQGAICGGCADWLVRVRA